MSAQWWEAAPLADDSPQPAEPKWWESAPLADEAPTERAGVGQTIKSGLGSAARGVLHVSESMFRTPETIRRIGSTLQRWSFTIPRVGPAALGAAAIDAVDWNDGVFRSVAAGSMYWAEKIDQSNHALSEMFPTFRRIDEAGVKANEALADALKGDFAKAGDVTTDPESWAIFMGQAVPSLYLAWKSGGSLPFMGWLEGMESAKDVQDFERRTGTQISDEQFSSSVAIVGTVNAFLEKIGLDAVTRGRGSILTRLAAGSQIEGLTEAVQEFTQNVSRKGYDEEAQFIDNMLGAYMGGAGSGAGAAAISGAADRLPVLPRMGRSDAASAQRTAEETLRGLQRAGDVGAAETGLVRDGEALGPTEELAGTIVKDDGTVEMVEAEPIERFQFMRDRSGSSPQMEILPLTQDRFIRYVRPILADGYAETLEEYQAKHPEATHLSLTRRGPADEWRARGVSSPDVLKKFLPLTQKVIRQVESFDSPEAQQWAAIDEEVGRRSSPEAVEKTDTLLTAVAKLGGISRGEAEAMGIDPAEFSRRGTGIKLVFTENGLTPEAMAERLRERGYPVEDEEGGYSGQVLIERVFDELRGRPVRTTAGAEADLERQYRERETEEARRALEERDTGEDEEEIGRAHLEASGVYDATPEQAIEQGRQIVELTGVEGEQERPETQQALGEVRARGDRGGAETPSGAPPAAAPVTGRPPERGAEPGPGAGTESVSEPARPERVPASEVQTVEDVTLTGEGFVSSTRRMEPITIEAPPEPPSATVTQLTPRRAARAEAEAPPGFEVDPATRARSEDEARINGGQYSAVARRLSPWKSEKGYGDTPLLAERNALKRVGALDPSQEAVRTAIGLAAETIEVGEEAPPPRDEDEDAFELAWKSELTRSGREDLARHAKLPDPERVAAVTLGYLSPQESRALVEALPTFEVGGVRIYERKQLPVPEKKLYVQMGRQRFEVESLEDASRKWREFRDRTGAGASEIGEGVLVVDEKGEVVAHVSYNGKVWAGRPQDWKAGMKPLVGKSFDEVVEEERQEATKKLAASMLWPTKHGEVTPLSAFGFESLDQIKEQISYGNTETGLRALKPREVHGKLLISNGSVSMGPNFLEVDLLSLVPLADYEGETDTYQERTSKWNKGESPRGNLIAVRIPHGKTKWFVIDQQYLATPEGIRIDEMRTEVEPGPDYRLTQKQIEAAAHEAAESPKNELPTPTQAQKAAENYKVGDPIKLHGVTWRVETPKGAYRFKFDEQELAAVFAAMPRGYVPDSEYQRILDLLRGGRIPEAFKEARVTLDHMRAFANEYPKHMQSVAKKMDALLKSSWFNKMPAHYARAVGVEGKDGDTLDAFLGPSAADETLLVYVIDTNKLKATSMTPFMSTEEFDEHKVMIGYGSTKEAKADFLASYSGDIGQRIFRTITEMRPESFREWAQSKDLNKPAAESILGTTLPKEATREPEQPQEPQDGQPQGAQPEGIPGARGERRPSRVREPRVEGSTPGDQEPDESGLYGTGGVGSGQVGLFEAAGPAALDFGRDRRPDRDLEGVELDGRSSESRRARAAGSVTGSDYIITADDALGKGGVKTKAKQNIAAIRIVKQIQADQRAATSEEQAALVKYVGWGGIPQIFDAQKADWRTEYEELKALLTPAEYEAARRSTQDAHYTSETVVRAMYTALDRLGFKSGKLLEPAAGIGHFFGMMPEALRGATQGTGVELDPMTAAIAQALYPRTKVHQRGFQDFAVPDNFYDVVIGNPPFGSQKLFDAERKALNDFSIHNYFIAKAVEVTRPGGVVAVVVSHYFLDTIDAKAREYIARQADLLGAIRLPNTAFLDNANTEVVTDIVFLQKKETPSGVVVGPDWTRANRTKIDDQEVHINRYFNLNPGMVLGKHSMAGKMYRGGGYTVEPTGGLETQLTAAIHALPQNVITARAAEHQAEVEQAVETVSVEGVAGVQVFGYFEKDGAFYQRVPDVAGEPRAEKLDISGAAAERTRALINLRNVVKEQLRMELADEPGMGPNRQRLNRDYDRFVKSWGYVHAQGNKTAFSGDPSYPLLLSLELDYDRGFKGSTDIKPRKPSAKKAAIFDRRVLVPFHSVTKVTSALDALYASMAERGRIDKDYIESIYDKPFDESMKELGDRVYEDHDGSGWTTADLYLSGNVKAKLKEAAAAAKNDARFERNVAALNKVIPADLEPTDISIDAGSPWIPAEYLVEFAKHLFGDSTTSTIVYVPAQGRFSAKINGGELVKSRDTWGTERMYGDEILAKYLHGTPLRVYDHVGHGQPPAFNPEASQAAQAKLEQIRRAFQDWVWEDTARRERLARLYNDTFNTDVERVYDGSHLGVTPDGKPQPFPGATPTIELRPHQKNFVWRFVQDGKTLADHVVGAGKTYASITAIMERKRLGLINKAMMTVPNHLVDQWAGDFTRLYPGARVLAATKRDFEKHNRRKFMAKIATGDWDAVIIAHSSFGFIKMPLATLEAFVTSQVREMEASMDMLRAAGGSDRRTIKQIEKAKERLEAKLEKQLEDSKKDNVLSFDELGVDALVVDEAHMFKNLMYATSLGRNVAGLGNTEGSLRAMDMFIKSRFILERSGNQNFMTLTGTPISNSIAEMYTVQRYMAYDDLQERGLAHFDAWARTFADAVGDWELKASGVGYEMKTRFRAFQNFPELMKMYRRFADVVTKQDLIRMRQEAGKPPLTPPLKTGKPIIVVVEPSPMQTAYMQSIVKRAEHLPKDPREDNMLKVTSDARKAALDMRLVSPEVGDHLGSTSHAAVSRIKGHYDEFAHVRGTQLVFIDLSTPKGNVTREQKRIQEIVEKAEEGDDAAIEALATLTPDQIDGANSKFDVYNDMRQKLVDAGVPEGEIEFIHNAHTELQKEALFEKVRQGQIRVLFGSTEKMGAGMNVQRRLVALHHMHAPWRPSDLEQREGRIDRQGNMLYEGDPDRNVKPLPGFEISIYRYATKQTYDARQWQTVETKARFIEQARHANMIDRRVEDIEGEAANAAAMKAAASGNPLIEEEIRLRSDIKKLENLEGEHKRKRHRLESFLKKYGDVDSDLAADLALIDKDIAKREPVAKGEFAGIRVRGSNFSERKKGGLAIVVELTSFIKSKKETTATVGSYRGFDFAFVNDLGAHLGIVMDGNARNYGTYFAKDEELDPLGIIARLDNQLVQFEDQRKDRIERAEQLRRETAQARTEIEKPFAQKAELEQKRARHQEVLKELSKKEEDKKGTPDDLSAAHGTISQKGKGLGVGVVKPFVEEMARRWKGMPAAVFVTTRQGLSGMPENVRRGLEGIDPRGIAMGLNHRSGRAIYIFADNIPSLTEAERIMIHEAKGHAGIEAFLGREYPKFRDSALRNFPKTAVQQAMHIKADLRTVAGRERVADEVIATIAERVEDGTATSAMLKYWDRLVQAVLKFLRSLGFTRYRPAQAEIREIIREAARQVERGPIAPGARPTALLRTAEEVQAALGPAQTETPEFKRWFGDSKVVDAEGQPLVVYHGSFGRRFARFRKDVPRRFDNEVSREGFFFADERTAVAFAKGDAGKFDQRYQNPQVYAVYLSLQNPAVIDGSDLGGNAQSAEEMAARIQAAKTAGHDGAIINGWKDGSGAAIQYVAFEPTQIKSAIGNRGTFDPRSSDITAALLDPENETNLARLRSSGAERAGNLFMRLLKDGQPVDRAFQKAFSVFGTIDSRGVFHLDVRAKVYAKQALDAAKSMIASKRFRFLHDTLRRAHNSLNEQYGIDEKAAAALEAVKRGIIDRYGQTPEFRRRSLGVEADRRAILLQGEDVLKRLLKAGVEAKEAEIMYRMMTVDGASEEELGQLAEDMKGLAPEIRDAITHMGQEYVELGLLPASAFEQWRLTYLPRSYRKHEQNQSALGRAFSNVLGARRKRIIGNQFKGRGITIQKPQARILRDVPEGWWGRTKNPKKADAQLVGKKFVVLERVLAQGALTRDIPGIDPKHVKEKVTGRVYWPADLQMPNKYKALEDRGTFVVKDVNGPDVVLWRDYTRPERERMGEIVDVRYAIAKAYMQAANDLSNGRFFRDIAQNPQWASKTDPTGNSPDGSERAGSIAAGAEWVRVPDGKIAETETYRYGALAGMYVRAEVWIDMVQLSRMQKAGFLKSVMTTWKLNKTARNPVVHFNNIMSNFVLMDLMDVRARDFVRGLRSYLNEDAHYRSAHEHGAFGADIVTQELKNTLLGPVLKEIEAETEIEQQGLLGVLGRLLTALRELDAKMIDMYRLEDEIFRMGAYIREIEHGATPEEAALHARTQFFNYDIRAPWINALRETVLPFIAYTYRAIPVIARSVADRPWKLAKYFTLAYLFNMLAYMVMDDDDEDEERATLREQEQGRTWIGVQRMLRAPSNDRFGNPIFWDIRRLVPAGDVFDMNQGSSALPVPAWLNFGGPLMIGAELMLNKAGFTGDEIYDPLTDTTGERTAAVGDFLWKSLAPSAPWIPGSWYWSKIEAAATGELDPLLREYSVPLALSSSLGLKLRPHDVAQQRRYLMADLDRVERALTENLRSLAIDLSRQRLDRDYYEEEVANIRAKLEKLSERRAELAPR